ncbi:hypothetical protein [Frigidibacter sp.]|uniref:hypothetical protein n=1 Tax=Frigidibacter sp. TaxID=2586418 RepID=UPI002735F10E|nr:hypothetical protein [Frigidibacter sp.]MDP3342373.1 hypothetical protein [Frigidibacter sp.]
MKISICLFGITRSLPYTANSINDHVIAAAQKFGEIRVHGHFYNVKAIRNARSLENSVIKSGHYDLLNFDKLEIEEPDIFLPTSSFEKVKSYGDAWEDDFQSLKNLFHQLHSIDKSYKLAGDYAADITLFARPDLLYHDDLTEIFERAAAIKSDSAVLVPRWQAFGGVNDRFALAIGDTAARAVSGRLGLAERFCSTGSEPLHSERLLKFALDEASVRIETHGLRASRVRSNGLRAKEIFDHSLPGRIKANAAYRINLLMDRIGLGLPSIATKE